MRRIASALIAIFCLVHLIFGPGSTAAGRSAPRPSQDLPHRAYLPAILMKDGENTQLVSIGPDWQLGNKDSSAPAMSADGRYVAFASAATNLLPGDTNNKTDIFVVDRTLASIRRASLSSTGAEADGNCGKPSISADGRYVAFTSTSTALVAGDANGKQDIFLRDMQTGQTRLVSVSSGGVQANENSYNPQISADGRYVVYETSASTLAADDTNAAQDVYLYDCTLAQTVRVSLTNGGAQGNNDSYVPAISADGRYVAFQSWASNLVSGDANNHVDVFVRDRQAGQTLLVSVTDGEGASNGDSGSASLSADGRYVVFNSDATNLVSGDTNAAQDVFVRDRQAGATLRVSLSGAGAQANEDSWSGKIAAGGRWVAFISAASNLVSADTNAKDDLFLRDLQTGATTRLSVSTGGAQGNNTSTSPTISDDGSLVAFGSTANNLVPGDTGYTDGIFITGADIFTRSPASGQTEVVSRLYAPMQSNAGSSSAVVSADGRYVAFVSKSTSLVPGDGGNMSKVFVRDMQTRQSVIASVSSSGFLSTGDSSKPSISASGQVVSFTSYSSELVDGDTNGVPDVFVRYLGAGVTARVSVATGGAGANDMSMDARISADGSAVCFSSYATNLAPGDTNATLDVFVRNLSAGATERVSVSSTGAQASSGYSGSCAISASGRFVAFQSTAANLVTGDTNAKQDIFVRDRQAGTTTLISRGAGSAQSDGDSYLPSISDDGRFVAFHSAASNLVPGDTNGVNDVFVFDRSAGSMLRASVSSTGAQAADSSFSAVISGNGQHVVFESIARNLIDNDTNKNNDAYMHNLITGKTERASVSTSGGQGDNASLAPSVSTSGRYVVFQSAASNLVSGDTNGLSDIFLHDCGTLY